MLVTSPGHLNIEYFFILFCKGTIVPVFEMIIQKQLSLCIKVEPGVFKIPALQPVFCVALIHFEDLI